MKTNKEIKKDIVSEIETNIENSLSVVVWKYHNLDSNLMAEVRKDFVRNNDVNKIYKNRLAKIAFENKGMEAINEKLIGPNAFLFLNNDSIDSMKRIYNLSKNNDAIEFVAGYIEGNYYDGEALREIASLPPKNDLLSMLLSVLQAPMRNLAYLISQIDSTKSE